MVVHAEEPLLFLSLNLRALTYWLKSTAGVKLCPNFRTGGIESYHRRYLVYTRRRDLLVIGSPGEYRT